MSPAVCICVWPHTMYGAPCHACMLHPNRRRPTTHTHPPHTPTGETCGGACFSEGLCEDGLACGPSAEDDAFVREPGNAKIKDFVDHILGRAAVGVCSKAAPAARELRAAAVAADGALGVDGWLEGGRIHTINTRTHDRQQKQSNQPHSQGARPPPRRTPRRPAWAAPRASTQRGSTWWRRRRRG